MTVSAPDTRLGVHDASAQPAAVPETVVIAGSPGYQAWLEWLQSLLSTSGLVLYRLDTTNADKLSNKASFAQLGCLPNKPSQAQRYAGIAMRSLRTNAVVNAKSGTDGRRTACCIPEVSADKDRRFRHVLVVLRNASSKLDLQTQARLVVWAFGALNKYSRADSRGSDVGELSCWASEQAKANVSSGVPLTQLMDRLTDLTGSRRCLLASLRMNGKDVSKVSLLALSRQTRLDTRLSTASALLSVIGQSFTGKQLPLEIIRENGVQPAMLAKTSIANTHQICNRLIIPLEVVDACFAVMLERDVDLPFSDTEIAVLCNDLQSALTVVQLSDPRTRGMMAASARRLREVRNAIRSSVPRSMLQAALILAAVIFFAYTAKQRISAPLNVEAAQRHVLIAPVDGYVESVVVKAGDAVLEGQTLATLDDRDLQMQRQKRQSEAVQNAQAYDKALASHDRIEVSRLKESASLIQTELRQLDMQQQRMTIKAPVDGVVLSGSWDDSLGAAVTTGDTLFTLGSSNSHRLVLDVSEYDVAQVTDGQPVDIRLSADPSTILDARVTAIMPLAVAVAGVNSVQVHAELVRSAQLRPGMQGIGKIVTGRRIRIMQWVDRIGARMIWLAWRLGVLK